MAEINLQQLLPYGDTTQDGAVQLSFTLPVEPSAKSREAATQMVRNWGFFDVKIAHMSAIGIGYSFFVVMARTEKFIDYTKVEAPQLDLQKRDYKEIDKKIL
ncbi:MAG: OAM dimerization domain-containing protein, partial [Pseudomonadota bacterium]